MNFRKLIQDYFSFTRSERKGVIVLLVLIFLLAVANKMIFYFEKPASLDLEAYEKAKKRLGEVNDSLANPVAAKTMFQFDPNTIDSLALDSLDLPEQVKANLFKFRRKGGQLKRPEDFRKIYGVNEYIFSKTVPFIKLALKPEMETLPKEKVLLFKFDPNTATDSEFYRLGFSEKQVVSIRNYLAKGGRFNRVEDFIKLKILSEKQKTMLADYIEIKENKAIFASAAKSKIEINKADSLLLKQLPGIGEKLSKRIINYRELLGGFYSIDQIKEVYGITDEVFLMIRDKLEVDQSLIRKLNLNFAGTEELARHPYIRRNMASRIVKFRSKFGKISSPEILRDSMILNIDEYQRLKPYF